MKRQLTILSFGLALSGAIQASAESASEQADSHDSWFGSNPADALYPIEPDSSASKPAPQRSSAESERGRTQHSSAPFHRSSATVPIRFEPGDSSVHLLTQEGMMPFDSLVVHGSPGWWGWPYGYGYYRETGVAPIYTPICEGACMSQVRRGPHQFALSRPGGPIVPIAGRAVISEPSLITARYIDRSSLRTTGVVIGVVGSLTGLVMMIFSVHDEQDCDGATCTMRSGVDEVLAAGGLGVFAGSIITSAVLLNQRDEARLSIVPLRSTGPEPRFETWSHSRVPLRGAQLSLRF